MSGLSLAHILSSERAFFSCFRNKLFFRIIYLFNLCGYFAYMFICVPRTLTVPSEARRGHQTLWNWRYRCLCAVLGELELNPGSLKEQSVLLIDKPSLRPPASGFLLHKLSKTTLKQYISYCIINTLFVKVSCVQSLYNTPLPLHKLPPWPSHLDTPGCFSLNIRAHSFDLIPF